MSTEIELTEAKARAMTRPELLEEISRIGRAIEQCTDPKQKRRWNQRCEIMQEALSRNISQETPTTTMKHELKTHWAADLFPINEGDVERLADSIREQGQLEPIRLTHDGLILDGRNRWLACQKAGVKPVTVTLEPMSDDELVKMAWAFNGDRRDLTKSQRACAAAETIKALQEDNHWDSKGGRGRKALKNERFAKGEEAMAAQFKVSTGMISMARQLLKEAPEIFAKVKSGENVLKPAFDDWKRVEEEKGHLDEMALNEGQIDQLRKLAPDLVEQVEKGDIGCKEAIARAEAAAKAERERLQQLGVLYCGFLAAYQSMIALDQKMTEAEWREAMRDRHAWQLENDLQSTELTISILKKLILWIEQVLKTEKHVAGNKPQPV